MKINKNKTNVMIVSTEENKTANIQLNGTPLSSVKIFSYLGSRITSDGRATQEISYRLHQARVAFNKKSKIFESSNISLDLRKRMLKTLVWSILLYGCETWCIGGSDYNKLEAFEMWCFRRMLRVSWRDHITNEEVLSRIKEKRTLSSSISERRSRWIGHTLRHDNLLSTIIEGTIEGKNRPGRPRREYIQQVIEDHGFSNYTELKRACHNRQDWKRHCHRLLPTSRF